MSLDPAKCAPYLEAPGLAQYSMHLRHGFFGRKGGESTGIYKSLNAGPGSSDKSEWVAQNRDIICQSLGVEAGQMVTLHQAHTNRPVVVDKAFAPGEAPEADALVSQRPGLLLTALAADCSPILMCDPHANIAAAVHAGWRGSLSGVIENTIETMCDLGASADKIVAAIGPCLAQQSFEVGPEFEDTFLKASPWSERLFEPGEGDRKMFDHKRYCMGRLARAGVGKVEALADDTLTQEEDYFSYRRSQRRDEPDYGRNASSIVLLG